MSSHGGALRKQRSLSLEEANQLSSTVAAEVFFVRGVVGRIGDVTQSDAVLSDWMTVLRGRPERRDKMHFLLAQPFYFLYYVPPQRVFTAAWQDPLSWQPVPLKGSRYSSASTTSSMSSELSRRE